MTATLEKQPRVELRNIKHFASLSEETHCYSATLYVDGELWGEVSNRGHGGCDDIRLAGNRSWDDIKALNARIAATYSPIECYGSTLSQDLEMLCCEAVNAWLVKREFNRAMGRAVLFVDPARPGDIMQFKLAKGRKPAEALPALRAKHPAYTFLADLPEAEALTLYTAI